MLMSDSWSPTGKSEHLSKFFIVLRAVQLVIQLKVNKFQSQLQEVLQTLVTE